MALIVPEHGEAPSDELAELVRENDWEGDDYGIAIVNSKTDDIIYAVPGDIVVKANDGTIRIYSREYVKRAVDKENRRKKKLSQGLYYPKR